MLPRSSHMTAGLRPAYAALLLFAAFTLSCAAPAELSRRSEAALAAGSDRQAYEWAERANRSFELGVTRIAVLPFDDDTGVPGLAEELAVHAHGQLSANMPQKKFPFVRFVSEDAIAGRARAEGRITREAAIRIGRSLGATRVVWGRLHGLHSDTHTDTWHDRVFRKVAVRDSSNRTRVRYDEVSFETVSREREVQVGWEFEVIETDEEETLVARSGAEQVTARTVFTRFDPSGDCDDYLLAPPEWKSENADGWKSAEKDWKQRYGDWSVPDFLEASHDTRDRGHYRRTDRESYLNRSRPRVGADLPPAGDLAFLALREMVNPLWNVLKGLEREPAP